MALAAGERSECTSSLLLRPISVNRGREDTGRSQLTRHPIGGTFGPAEHEGLTVLCDELRGELDPIRAGDPPEVVRDVGHLRSLGLDFVARRVVLVLSTDRLYFLAHGRREQEHLPIS